MAHDERYQDQMAAISIGASLVMLGLGALFLVVFDEGRSAAICAGIGVAGLVLMGALLSMRRRRRGLAAPAGTAESRRWAVGFLVVMAVSCAVMGGVGIANGWGRSAVAGPVGAVLFGAALVQTLRRGAGPGAGASRPAP